MVIIDTNFVRKKVETLMKKRGILKGKLGEVLGSKGDHANVRINRANRFLYGDKKKITVQEVNALAEFFERPVSWFLFDDSKQETILNSSEKETTKSETPLREIEKNLRKMGFEEDFVSAQIQQIKAMETYRAARGKQHLENG